MPRSSWDAAGEVRREVCYVCGVYWECEHKPERRGGVHVRTGREANWLDREGNFRRADGSVATSVETRVADGRKRRLALERGIVAPVNAEEAKIVYGPCE